MQIKILLYFILFSSFVSAQPGGFVKKKAIEDATHDKLKANVMVGTEVGTSFKNTFWFTSYIMPSLSFSVSNRFTLVSGIGFANTQINNPQLLSYVDESNSANYFVNSVFGYVGGIYQLSNNLKVSAIYSTESGMVDPYGLSNMNSQIQSGSFGVHYKVNSFLSVDAQIKLSNKPYSNTYGFNNGLFNQNTFNSFSRSPYF